MKFLEETRMEFLGEFRKNPRLKFLEGNRMELLVESQKKKLKEPPDES